jgi:hypothetical protein
VGYEAIPSSLAKRPQWLVWKFEQKEGDKKPRKVPHYTAGHRRVGEQGTPEDRARLVTLEDAAAAMAKLRMDGVGFAFLPGDGLIGIDIDGAIDLESGEIAERARSIIEACSSYTEYSPSRRGVHIIVAGESETFKSNAIGLEVFCGRQFFTFTGERYSDTPEEVQQIDAGVLRRLRATVEEAKGRGGGGLKAVNGAPAAAPGPEDSRAKLESALAFIPPDLGYDDWLQVGMALYAELGAGGISVWDYWSSKGQKYQGLKSLDVHWKSFVRGGVSTVTGAKIFRLATDHGWRAPRRARLHSVKGGKPAGEGGAEKSVSTPRERSAKGEAKPRGDKPAGFLEQVEYLRERYTLIYGTETVYDHEEHDILRVAHLRLAMGKDAVNWWLYGKGRRMVSRDHVVFDPSEASTLPEYVNLFYGMPMKPDPAGACSEILELLLYLCNDEHEVFTWVLKWIAYPLQHPGAKMETAIVMHGEEGAGKNLFWEVVRTMYGPYASVITQNELESQFNTWATRKLFMIANEVVSRSELREHKGRLKNYITERELQINEKLLPLRTEENHMNFVFLSNETQPLALDRTDRRYLVLWTPPARPPDFYAKVSAELHAGGAAAFYAHLLALELGDFNEHAKPIITQAKRNLIEISKIPPELFFDQWSAGLLPVPYHSAKAADLYRAFIRWCAANGEKHPPSQTRFGAAMRRLGVASAVKWLRPTGGAERQATVYEVKTPEDSPHYGEKLEKLVSGFAEALDYWQRGDVNT